MNSLNYQPQTRFDVGYANRPYKICPQKPPVKIVHEILWDAAFTPSYTGIITLPQRRLENIIALKVNLLYVPNNAGGLVASGRTKLLLSNTLGSLARTNQFLASHSTGPSSNTNAEPISNIIGYSLGASGGPLAVSCFDNDRVLWFNKPENIQSFDWSVIDLVTFNYPDSNVEKNILFEIEFFYACDCK